MYTLKKATSLILCLFMLAVFAFAGAEQAQPELPGEQDIPGTVQQETEKETAKLQQDVVVLFTSDVHCGNTQGFGLGGLMAIRDTMAKTNHVLLVDDGDFIQGGAVGLLTRGEANIRLMNTLRYDLAIPGNHEFDYGTDRFLELAGMAEFPYLSCNITREGERVFPAWLMKEFDGVKIAFVGVTTPETLISSTPRFFQNEKGETIYAFAQGDGSELCAAVQESVDEARNAGADYVFLVAHLGYEAAAVPYTYADVVSGTTGIDAVLDGHSHDTEKVVMKNKEGRNVIRQACGTKMQAIGWLRISAADGSIDTGLYTWNNNVSMPELTGITNAAQEQVIAYEEEIGSKLEEVVGTSMVDLVSNDPTAKDDSGAAVRLIRRAETNLGDLIADALKGATGAETAIISGGGIRDGIKKGRVTLLDVQTAMPFNNQVLVVEATGQQILNALEWGAQTVPEENGAFCHVSGITYEIHTYIASGCKSDAEGMFAGVDGEYRVKNVMINGEPLDPERKYTVGGPSYALINHGNGQTAFDGCAILQEFDKNDFETVADYIKNNMNGEIGMQYANPYGDGRIIGIPQPPQE